MERLVIGWFVVISVYESARSDASSILMHYTIPWDDLKVDDLQHLLEWLYREVSESTP